jgi:hypothetical protein
MCMSWFKKIYLGEKIKFLQIEIADINSELDNELPVEIERELIKEASAHQKKLEKAQSSLNELLKKS